MAAITSKTGALTWESYNVQPLAVKKSWIFSIDWSSWVAVVPEHRNFKPTQTLTPLTVQMLELGVTGGQAVVHAWPGQVSGDLAQSGGPESHSHTQRPLIRGPSLKVGQALFFCCQILLRNFGCFWCICNSHTSSLHTVWILWVGRMTCREVLAVCDIIRMSVHLQKCEMTNRKIKPMKSLRC